MAKITTRSVSIGSLADLVDLVNHNFSSFDRQIKKLMKSNQSLKILSVVAIGCAIYAAAESGKREEQVYQLSIRVQKLEHGEGE